MHHIITDGWSIGVAAGELAALYDAFRRGAPSPLPALPIQYADYAAWQRRLAPGRGRATARRLLARAARRASTPLELPTDRPRPPIRTAAARSSRSRSRPTLAEPLRALCRREGATLFMMLLAAFQTLLHRYSGQDDIVVGTPIANRNRAEVEGLIGYFVNTLALRTDLSGDPSFRDLLAPGPRGRPRRLRAPGPARSRRSSRPSPPRDPSRTPLFQVMFVLQNNRLPDLGRPELTLEPLASTRGPGRPSST